MASWPRKVPLEFSTASASFALCVLWLIDHKQKWLPKEHEETQQEGFGKRGIPIFGGAATRWTGSEYEVLNIRVALDDSAQNW